VNFSVELNRSAVVSRWVVESNLWQLRAVVSSARPTASRLGGARVALLRATVFDLAFRTSVR